MNFPTMDDYIRVVHQLKECYEELRDVQEQRDRLERKRRRSGYADSFSAIQSGDLDDVVGTGIIMTDATVRVIKECFNFMDTQNDSVITFHSFLPNALSNEDVLQKFFEMCDQAASVTNQAIGRQDSRIEFDEFLFGIRKHVLSEQGTTIPATPMKFQEAAQWCGEEIRKKVETYTRNMKDYAKDKLTVSRDADPSDVNKFSVIPRRGSWVKA